MDEGWSEFDEEPIAEWPLRDSFFEKSLSAFDDVSPDWSPSKRVKCDYSTEVAADVVLNTEAFEVIEVVPDVEVIEVEVNLAPYMVMTQADAAKELRIPPSTLSKHWLEATRGTNRIWPYQKVLRLDKKIREQMDTVDADASSIPHEIEYHLTRMLKQRASLLAPVRITIRPIAVKK